MLSAPLLPSSASSSAAILTRALPQLRAFSLFAQDAHWQVTGPLFGILHPLFGELYDMVVTAYSDAIAERIRQLNARPPLAAGIEPLAIGGEEGSLLAAQCLQHAQKLGAILYRAMDELKAYDVVFLAVFQDLQARLEKLLWQIGSHAG